MEVTLTHNSFLAFADDRSLGSRLHGATNWDSARLGLGIAASGGSCKPMSLLELWPTQ